LGAVASTPVSSGVSVQEPAQPLSAGSAAGCTRMTSLDAAFPGEQQRAIADSTAL
jgi:hypothetical protein